MAETLHLLLFITIISFIITPMLNRIEANPNLLRENRVIEASTNPENVIWVVQLSDLHFSVHHPNRALHFNNFIPSVLSFINPSLVLITGDLTGGQLMWGGQAPGSELLMNGWLPLFTYG